MRKTCKTCDFGLFYKKLSSMFILMYLLNLQEWIGNWNECKKEKHCILSNEFQG